MLRILCRQTATQNHKKWNSIGNTCCLYHDFVEEGQFISQAHRCLFFGKKAEMIAEKADKGRHIHIRGMIRSQRQGESQDARYFTNVIVEEFRLSPRQSVEAVNDVLREMLAKDKITHCEQLGIFQ